MDVLTSDKLYKLIMIGFIRPDSNPKIIINNKEDVIDCRDALDVLNNFKATSSDPNVDPIITYKGKVLSGYCYLLPNNDICLKTYFNTLDLSQGTDSIPKDTLLDWINRCKEKLECDVQFKTTKDQDDYKQMVKGVRTAFRVLEDKINNYGVAVEIGGNSNE